MERCGGAPEEGPGGCGVEVFWALGEVAGRGVAWCPEGGSRDVDSASHRPGVTGWGRFHPGTHALGLRLSWARVCGAYTACPAPSSRTLLDGTTPPLAHLGIQEALRCKSSPTFTCARLWLRDAPVVVSWKRTICRQGGAELDLWRCFRVFGCGSDCAGRASCEITQRERVCSRVQRSRHDQARQSQRHDPSGWHAPVHWRSVCTQRPFQTFAPGAALVTRSEGLHWKSPDPDLPSVCEQPHSCRCPHLHE